jgi:hypothetical protein
MRLSQALLEVGFIRLMADASLFYYHFHNFSVFVLIYVDDIIITRTSSDAISVLTKHLKCEFAIKDLGPLSNFLGI